MAQWLRVLSVLAKDPGLTLGPRDVPDVLFYVLQVLARMCCMQAHKDTHKFQKIFFFKIFIYYVYNIQSVCVCRPEEDSRPRYRWL